MTDAVFTNALSAAFQVKEKPASDEVRRLLQAHCEQIARMAKERGKTEQARGAISHLNKLLETPNTE